MSGPDPASHVFCDVKAWMDGSSPSTTKANRIHDTPNFKSLKASKSWTPPPTRFVV
jgi:hypothetical protein